ncbi:SRPBCC domain-containing protein [Nocardia cyriacigeorgica]|nr:polyketide cyclase [Nocardia cyriacigeorgica]MBF6498524.1 SRPBCC domain-containing protein [Nocardia cyriacigeorgica]PPJ01330.1 polyketide cyclase [Nocardia cyriacigeorgica]
MGVFVVDGTVEIAAPADVVWGVITGFERYGEWNPFVSECRSTLEVGAPIDMVVHLTGSKPRRQREFITSHTPGEEFSYSMKPVPFGALHSRRTHTVTPLGPDRTRYESHFELGGWLKPVVELALGKALRRGFTGMTEGVARQAESLHAA